MINKEFIELAKQKVLEYHTEHFMEPYDDRITLDNVFVAWYSKVLQNHKALLGISDMDDQHYYEVTYNGDKKQLYLDVYDKQENKCYDLEVGE